MDMSVVFCGGLGLGVACCWGLYTYALIGYELRKGIESA